MQIREKMLEFSSAVLSTLSLQAQIYTYSFRTTTTHRELFLARPGLLRERKRLYCCYKHDAGLSILLGVEFRHGSTTLSKLIT